MTKKEYLKNLVNDNGVIAALAIDQRGALKHMMAEYMAFDDAEKDEEIAHNITWFKKIISKELTPYVSSILLDPEYGLPATEEIFDNTGLLMAYEKTGYDALTPGRLPDSLKMWSVKRIKEAGSDAVKFLLYYDIDENNFINDQKKAYIERIGSECVGEDIPFFLELVSYDAHINDSSSKEYATKKPHKVIEMMKEFSKARYNIDVLKVEVPVNMKYTESYSDGEVAYSKEQAAKYFKEQAEATDLPFIFLSAGVSIELFKETLLFAKESGSTFNGVLCGRANWAGAVEVYIKEGHDKASEWCKTVGRENIESLNEVLFQTATPLFNI